MRHVKLFEQFLNEAARIGSSSWRNILSDLQDYNGWTIQGEIAMKGYTSDEDEERRVELTVTVFEIPSAGEENEISSNSFDAEGLSAGELDSEIWNYTEEE
jgi:hypothetical protein